MQLAACLDYNTSISVNRKCKQMHVSFVSSVEVDSTNHDTMTERWAGDDGISDYMDKLLRSLSAAEVHKCMDNVVGIR